MKKPASVSEIRKELRMVHPDRLVELCLAMAKYKKDNKELLAYLLFNSDDELEYCKEVKAELGELFEALNTSTPFFAKKTLRKILRTITKHVSFSGSKRVEVELLVFFCKNMRASGLRIKYNPTLLNMYERQIAKITKSLATLHEDLQADYADEVGALALR